MSFLTLSSGATESPRSVRNFNKGWTFNLGDVPNASSPDFNDTKWRQLDLPHDWAIEGEFSKDNYSGTGGGALPGGIGWYRKTFKTDASQKGKKVFIDFDGVYMNAEVWINGTSLGIRPYGYISFRYDLTPYLKYGETNVLAVRVDNSEQPNSRWYSGCGIYRNVWLTTANPVYIGLWGTYVTTPKVSKKEALINVATTIKNDSKANKSIELQSVIIDHTGKKVAGTKSNVQLASGDSKEVFQEIRFSDPLLWSLENSYMYKVVSKVIVNGTLIDEYTTPLGVRSFSFDVNKGFILNGIPTK